MRDNTFIKYIIGGSLTVLGYLYGAFDGMITAILAMMILDFVSGIIVAFARKEIDSKIMYLGGLKKIGIMCIIAAANIVDVMLELSGVLRALTISYFIANEGISLLENWGKLGLPVPQRLRDVLKQLKKEE